MNVKLANPRIWLAAVAAAGAMTAACGGLAGGYGIPGLSGGSAAARVATVTASDVDVFSGPDADSVAQTLEGKTEFGSPRTFLVLASQDDMVEVQLPTRPNGATGWVKASDVDVSEVPYAVHVDLGANKLTVTRGDEVVLEEGTSDGKEATPTPAGTLYITDLLATGKDSGPYGPFAFGLSGHSDVLTDFAGGDGQLGIHGTNTPNVLGKEDVSSGCVRIDNESISKLAKMLPLGTPVFVA